MQLHIEAYRPAAGPTPITYRDVDELIVFCEQTGQLQAVSSHLRELSKVTGNLTAIKSSLEQYGVTPTIKTLFMDNFSGEDMKSEVESSSVYLNKQIEAEMGRFFKLLSDWKTKFNDRTIFIKEQLNHILGTTTKCNVVVPEVGAPGKEITLQNKAALKTYVDQLTKSIDEVAWVVSKKHEVTLDAVQTCIDAVNTGKAIIIASNLLVCRTKAK